jgi:hypothetical protein
MRGGNCHAEEDFGRRRRNRRATHRPRLNGRTGPAGVLLGHVAEMICAKSTRPLLCVKKKGEVVNFLHGLLQLFEMESRD